MLASRNNPWRAFGPEGSRSCKSREARTDALPRNPLNAPIVHIERTGAGSLIVSSGTIAEGSGVQHKNVLETIARNQADLEQFGRVAFQTRPFATAGGTQHMRIALLNEQ